MSFNRLEDIFFFAAVGLYLVSMTLYFYTFINKKDSAGKKASFLLKIGFLLHTLAIIFRGFAAGRVPLSNQYEFATTFAWGIALFLILFERKYKYYSISAFVVPILFIVIGYAAMRNREIRPLMPALQSWWLVIHVAMAIIAYGSFAVACGVSLMYLSKDKGQKENDRLPDKEVLDEISYKAVIFGFLFLTLCIITGAFWAQKSWGRYWAWDPKETWSLITWIIYTAYLHMRKTKDLRGRKAAIFAVLGFVAVLFTYIGVNTFLPSLHSYA